MYLLLPLLLPLYIERTSKSVVIYQQRVNALSVRKQNFAWLMTANNAQRASFLRNEEVSKFDFQSRPILDVW